MASSQPGKAFFGPEEFLGVWTTGRRIEYARRPAESWQGMPVGTGRTGAMVWAPGGLVLQLSHTDCWAEDGSLPSLLRVEVRLCGDPFASAGSYHQVLDLERAAVFIRATAADGDVRAAVRAHPELDVIWIEVEDLRREPGELTVLPHVWRQDATISATNRVLAATEVNYATAFAELNHRTGVTSPRPDPLLGLVRGAAIAVDGLSPSRRDTCFRSGRSPAGAGAGGTGGTVATGGTGGRRWRIFLAAGVGSGGDQDALTRELEARLVHAVSIPSEELIRSHEAFWRRFWQRSYIELRPDSPLEPLRAAWYMNRYFAASSMCGAFPPKFNGSIFLYEFDRRCWGGAYWFQNTRLQYWPLLRSGDSEYLPGLFTMYWRALDYAKERVRNVYGHGGAMFIETMYFWGAGRPRDVTAGQGVTNRYIRAHFSGILELLMMMLEYLRHQPGDAQVQGMLFDIAEPAVDFFFEHFPRVGGKLFLAGSQALETWWDADDPADQIAGLRAVLPRLVALGRRAGIDPQIIAKWEQYLPQLPELPRGELRVRDGEWQTPGEGTAFLPARAVHHKRKENSEDPELYAVWPFNLVGLGAAFLEEGRLTYERRLHPHPNFGWSQTAIWAARLGLAEEAAKQALHHFAQSATLPGGLMTSPGARLPGRPHIHDCAYFDTPGALATAVGEMLLQDHGEEVALLPAWPRSEPVAFRLHAAGKGPVEYEHRV